jgi:hypothetical protein
LPGPEPATFMNWKIELNMRAAANEVWLKNLPQWARIDFISRLLRTAIVDFNVDPRKLRGLTLDFAEERKRKEFQNENRKS